MLKKKKRKLFSEFLGGRSTRMVTYEAPELSSYGHIKGTDTHQTIIFERNPETQRTTPTHWVNKKIPTSKWIGKAETTLLL